MFSKAYILGFVAAAAGLASAHVKPAKVTELTHSQSNALSAAHIPRLEPALTANMLEKRGEASPVVTAPAQAGFLGLQVDNKINNVRANLAASDLLLPTTTLTYKDLSVTVILPVPSSSARSTQTITITSGRSTTRPTSTATVVALEPSTRTKTTTQSITKYEPVGLTLESGTLYSTFTSEIGLYTSIKTVKAKGAAPLATGVGVAGMGAAALGAAVALL